jgi:hypothetical protein
MKRLANLDMSQCEVQNAVAHKLGTAPSTPKEGQEYYNSATHRKYLWNGTEWVPEDGLGATMTGDSIVTAINGSSSTIDDDNLSTLARDAITKRHSHSNQTILDNTTASYTTAEQTKLSGIATSADVTDATNVGTSINGVTAKTTPVDADVIPLLDSASSNVLKKVTWANVKATLKTYFDTLYSTASLAWANITDKPTSTVADIDDAVTKKHSQNTDTGTSSSTFTVGTSGVKVKNSAGTELQVRNNGDTDYADLRVKNLVVEGTTTTIKSETLEIGDSEILLNQDITTSAGNSDGGVAVKRLMADNTTRKDAKLNFNTSTNRWQMVWGAITGTLITSDIPAKLVQTIGNGTLTTFTITHNFNTRDIAVTIRETASPYAEVEADVEFTDLNTVTVKTAVAPTSNQYTVTLIG